MVRRKGNRSEKSLVTGYIERISSKIFSDFSRQLTDLVGRQHGVYALYKGKRLYYVGLATNLRWRIKQHLKDKHSGKWDKFSLYLVREAEHIKELESLIMRVASPSGNAAKGGLPKADNLKAALHASMKGAMDKRMGDLLGRKETKPGRRRQKTRRSTSEKGLPTLAVYVKKRFSIRGTYKGKTYVAVVNKSGSIRFDGEIYNSPSMAGEAARKRSTNGWTFWHYKNRKGEWVKLDELRR